MIKKILGGLSIFVGFLFIFVFPQNVKFQPRAFTRMAAVIGIVLILVGVYLLMM